MFLENNYKKIILFILYIYMNTTIKSIGHFIYNGTGIIPSKEFNRDRTIVGVKFIGFEKKHTKLPKFFLHFCTTLKSIDLSSFGNVTHIDDFFLNSCWSLKSLDMSQLVNLTSIGKCFLNGCRSLESIILPPQMDKIEMLYKFLYIGGIELKTIDLSYTRCDEEFINKLKQKLHRTRNVSFILPVKN